MTSPAESKLRRLALEPGAAYTPHRLHGEGRTYTETNCYTDVLIELLHGCGYEPLAALGHLVAADFEGDQWTFFKPPPADLQSLFGIDIHEMQLYRSLPDHLLQQLDTDRTVIVELDAWHLPDTRGTSYRSQHVKTSVAVAGVNVATATMLYFHNTGLHTLDGEDFLGALRIGCDLPDEVLPPYAEVVRFDAGQALTGQALRCESSRLLGEHLARRPGGNPFVRYGEHLELELPRLVEQDLEQYHAYAFATARMAGATFELLSAHARWLYGDDASAATAELLAMVEGCKALSFRLARRRVFDPGELAARLETSWTRAMAALDALASGAAK